MGYFNVIVFIFSVFLLVLAMPGHARADCSDPTAKEGALTYNLSYKTMQFCDGTTWWNMKGGGGSASIDTSECQDGEQTIYVASSGKIECPADNTPDAFSFIDQTDVDLSASTESNILQIMNMDDGRAISISGTGSPEYRICADATCSTAPAYTAAAGTIDNGDYLQLRLTSSADYATAFTATLIIGDTSDQWDVTTAYTYSYTAWSGWSSCSASCGGGTQTRTRSCLRDQDGTTVSCSFCGGVCSESQSCNTQSCCVPNMGAGCGVCSTGTIQCDGTCAGEDEGQCGG